VTVAGREAVPDWFRPWFAWLDVVLHRQILRLRGRYELSLDELRGLYVSDAQVDALLAERLAPSGGIAAFEEWDQRAGSLLTDALQQPNGPLIALRRSFGLGEAETAVIALTLAPELDPKYQILLAYLNDDVTQKWVTVDVAHRLTGLPLAELQPGGRVLREGLVEVIPAGGAAPWRTGGLALTEAVRSHLLAAAEDVTQPGQATAPPALEPLARAIRDGLVQTVVIEVTPGAEPDALAREVAVASGRDVLFSPVAPDGEDADGELEGLLVRARLREAAVFFPAEYFGLDEAAPPRGPARRRLRRALDAPVLKLVGVVAGSQWRPALANVDFETIVQAPPEPRARREIWRHELSSSGASADEETLAELAGLFALHAGQIRLAARSATRRWPGRQRLGRSDLCEHAREQCAAGLEALAQRVDATRSWDDLVLPAATLLHLRQLADAVRHRHLVFGEWGFARHSGGSRSLRALFSGASGTGKTLAAGVIAGDLGLPLYRIDLSSVVSKYIGETEKNLERVFLAAEGSNGLLFFDEADALFGKRSEVKDAHDRYANIEVAYLLQRMETYDGVMILSTNLAGNMDEAFRRRLHFEVEFPLPDVAERERLWRLHLPPEAPRHDDVDVAFLARQFPLAGGDIRNVALGAAFLAAQEEGVIGMDHVIRSLGRERSRHGRLPSRSEFQQYSELVRAGGATPGKGT
jgi:hypothetical protein